MNWLPPKSVFLLAGLIAAVAPTARGQVGPVQGGRALDKNLGVGTGGVNTPVRRFVPNQANLTVTGNVTGGQAFRGFSPIRDSSQLFTHLPSSSLSNFRRDSFSVDELQSGIRGGQYVPYFSRSQTVTDAGAIRQGLNAPGSSVPLTRHLVPRYESHYVGPTNTIDGAATRIMPEPVDLRSLDSIRPEIGIRPLEDRRSQRRGSRLEASPLFQRISRLESRLQAHETLEDQPFQRGEPGELIDRAAALPRDPAETRGGSSADGRETGLGARPLDGQVDGRVEGRVFVDPVQGDRVTLRPAGQPESTTDASSVGPEGADASAPGSLQPLHRPLGGQPRPTRVPRGGDVFRDMWLAVGAESTPPGSADATPGTPAGRQPRKSIPDVLREIEEAQDRTAAEADADTEDIEVKRDPFRQFLAAPVKTFVGTDRTAVNEYLVRAEAAMRDGSYYRAAALYDMASAVDPENPLPILGRAHATLAAGDYLAAARRIMQVVEMFPQIAMFKIDLRTLVAREDTLDIRRADLERILETRENADLRFLLGYVEYYSGFESFGLKNLARAADDLGPSSPAALFHQMLENDREESRSPAAPDSPSGASPATDTPTPPETNPEPEGLQP